jgi:hypothetical protein
MPGFVCFVVRVDPCQGSKAVHPSAEAYEAALYGFMANREENLTDAPTENIPLGDIAVKAETTLVLGRISRTARISDAFLGACVENLIDLVVELNESIASSVAASLPRQNMFFLYHYGFEDKSFLLQSLFHVISRRLLSITARWSSSST